MSTRTEIPGGEVATVLYGVVRENPGIHFRGLKRAAGVSSNGQLRHHIDRLRSEGAVLEIEDGGFTRFFVAGEYEPDLRDAIARFARRVPRTIGKLLLRGPMTRTELREALGCADSTLGYHLNRMIQQGDLERDRRDDRSLYVLTDPDQVRRVLEAVGEAAEATEAAEAPVPSNNGAGRSDRLNGAGQEGDACPSA